MSWHTVSSPEHGFVISVWSVNKLWSEANKSIKGTLAQEFLFVGFGQKDPSRLMIKVLKYFQFWVWICRDIQLLCICHFLSIHTNSYCVLLLYEQIQSAYSQYMDIFSKYAYEISFEDLTSFCVFFIYIQIHSAYSQFTNKFIPQILSIRTDSFHVFGECAQIIIECSEWNYFLQSFEKDTTSKTWCTVYALYNRTLGQQGKIIKINIKNYFRIFTLYAEWPY